MHFRFKVPGFIRDEEQKLTKHSISYEQYLKKSKQEFELRLNKELKPSGKLEDFKMCEVIGSGSFGIVILCLHKATRKPYAIKILEKSKVIRSGQRRHAISEIRCMESLKYPSIVHLDFFFKNNVYLFLAMPFINGGHMFFHLQLYKRFEEPLCRFYSAQVILALEYLHFLGVVYRDLKPENILVDNRGYLKITDLGFCKRIGKNRTYTLCGKYLLYIRRCS